MDKSCVVEFGEAVATREVIDFLSALAFVSSLHGAARNPNHCSIYQVCYQLGTFAMSYKARRE